MCDPTTEIFNACDQFGSGPGVFAMNCSTTTAPESVRQGIQVWALKLLYHRGCMACCAVLLELNFPNISLVFYQRAYLVPEHVEIDDSVDLS